MPPKTPQAGYSGTPLPRKLGIKEGSRVGTLHAPAHFIELLVPMPADVRVETLQTADHPAGSPRFDVAVAFFDTPDALGAAIAGLAERIEVDGAVWMCWPKMASALFRGMKENVVRETGLENGLVDNKVCAIDADWSGLRFVYRRDDRPALRTRRESE